MTKVQMSKGVILSVDDDENLQVVIAQYLEDDGYKIITANSVASAVEKVDLFSIDVILLDLTLPDGEGLSLIPQFHNKSSAGIIVVSGKTDTTERIICLEMGADDFITKPFEMRELSARVKAVMRRLDHDNDNQIANTDQKDQMIISFGDWVLNRAQYQVFNKAGEAMDFTTGEFQLLEVLISAPNRVLTREQLFSLTREGKFDIYDRAIDIQVARIRKKLGDHQNTIIKTIRGVGYMFSDA